MCFRVKMFRLESLLLYIFYIWSARTLILTTAECTNLTLDCTHSIIIISPEYPDLYPNDASNEWYITAPLQRRILITFNDFSLEYIDDTIVIKDMVNSLNKEQYTGEDMKFSPFLTQSYSLHIKFTSSEEIRRRGFNISLTCYNTSSAVAILVDGQSPSEGFLQLSLESGEKRRVCEESLSSNVAEIICKELGYPDLNEISYFNDTCLLEGHCIRSPSCQDNVYRIVDCSTHDHSICSSNKSVKVKCYDVGYKGCFDLGSIKLRNGSSFQSKEQCIFSCRRENTKPIAIMNQTDCFCSTDDEIKDTQRGSVTQCTGIPTSKYMMSVYSASIGFCKELNDTIGGSWDSKITWFGSIVHLTCMEGYSLRGNGTLQCVLGESQFHLLWNDSIPTCEEVTVTDKPTVVTDQFEVTDKPTVVTDQFEVFDITSSVHVGMASTPTKVPPYSKECVPPTTQTLVFMGTTGGLAILLLFIASCWIVSRIRRHLSTKHVAKKEVTHTYLDMSRSLQRGDTQNQGTALNASLSRPLPGTQSRDEGDKDTKHLKPTVVYYESIPSNKLNVNYESATGTVPAGKLDGHYESATDTVLSDLPEGTYVNANDEDHLEDVEQDDFGYILPSTRPILTVPSNVLPSQVRQSGGQFRPHLTFDEDGYLDPRS